ncbi:TetR/AcrR family transcriptional regulator [Nonomuraea lactucae]|uniref:TetR/AcrR family transcriptional regulator n=1 Tax=Nonomuraea lactucae TaxID=2249762 RepID=UPI000DE4AAF0
MAPRFLTLPSCARGQRTRAALVAAGRRVFERDGYLDARLIDIAAEAKCSTGSSYTYFASKEEILQAVIEAALISAVSGSSVCWSVSTAPGAGVGQECR